MSIDGIDMEYGFTTPNMHETRISQIMMKAAAQVIVVADSSKFGQRRTGIICPINAVQAIITNKNISNEDLQALKNKGVEIFLV